MQTSAATSLASLRAMARHAQTQSQRLDGDTTDTRLVAVRDALAALDVALGLVTELPADTSGALVAALRKRIDDAFAALSQLDASQQPVR